MSARRPLYAANWKMYKSPLQTREYVEAFAPEAALLTDRVDIVLCAPFTDLAALVESLGDWPIGAGAQDCYWAPEGAFTGEVSASMIATIGCRYCIVGHSERRQHFGETDAMVAKKVRALIAEGVTPIVCVGETLEEHKAGATLQRVMQQVSDGVGHLSDEERAAIVIAYEPIWAIGTGLADTPENANRTIALIRQTAGGLDDARIVYGGSMKAENAMALCEQPDIDGGLVGSASLHPAAFLALVKSGLGDA
ncbi:MAG TPA: triose-phosphate isomerase [Candidatus Eremiobacteraceae bacterium]|nr:triose-phosphate isomerase [Candidatus Eremiobacteraceae bacterium]